MSRIVALGGGGFAMEENNILPDEYIFQKAKSDKPKVCFIATASGDSREYIGRFYTAMEKHNAVPSELSLYRIPTKRKELERYILEKDVIYVGGGNTFNLMALWQTWGLHSMLRNALKQGVVLAGMSAGAICWYESGVTDSFVSLGSKTLDAVRGLGFLKRSHCPHYNGEANRRSQYHRLIKNGELENGIAAEDGVGLFYENGKFVEAVSSRADGRAFFVEKVSYKVVEVLSTLALFDRKKILRLL